MNAALLASAQNSPAWDSLQWYFKGGASLIIASLGTVFCGMLGSVIYPSPPGAGAIAGCLLGLLVFSIIGCCATGFFFELISERIQPQKFSVRNALPHSWAMRLGGVHGKFELVLTVHKVTTPIHVMNKLPWQGQHMFVMVQCGDNPDKCTKVKQDGNFSQQFKLMINPSDEYITLILKDQDVFGATSIGWVHVDIANDVIAKDFPVRQEFDIQAGDSYSLKHVEGLTNAMILSFEYTDKYDTKLLHDHDSLSKSMRRDRWYGEDAEEKALNEAEQGDNYGSIVGTFMGTSKKRDDAKMKKIMQKLPVFQPDSRSMKVDAKEERDNK